MLSPYFSSIKRKDLSSFIADSLVQLSNDDSSSDAEVKAKHIAPCFAAEIPLCDPLFRFYFHKFLDLYQLLFALKPKLIQEVVASDPWKLLVAVTLLNKTTGKVAIPVFWDIMKQWPTPWDMSQARRDELKSYLYRLGTYNIRSERLIELSKAYIVDPPSEHDARPSRPPSPTKHLAPSATPRPRERYPSTPISHLPGTGPYALDSYRIFCRSHNDPFCEEWKHVHPTDKELVLYLRWKWAYEERKKWSPHTGCVESADILYLDSLVGDLTDYHIRLKQ